MNTSTNLINAINNLTEDRRTITLQQDIVLSDSSSLTFNSGGNVTLDLGENSLSTENLSDGEKLIVISGDTNLTIRGSQAAIASNEIGIYMDSTFT